MFQHPLHTNLSNLHTRHILPTPCATQPTQPPLPGAAVTTRLEELDAACDDPTAATLEEASTCGRCRAELGARGRVCAHCQLDERVLQWELRLFTLTTRALALGAAVSLSSFGWSVGSLVAVVQRL